MRGDKDRMAVRKIGDGAAERDRPGRVSQRRDEHQTARNVLDGVRKMLPAKRLRVTELIGQDECLPVLLDRFSADTPLRMYRHNEVSKLHRSSETPACGAGHLLPGANGHAQAKAFAANGVFVHTLA
jgi:hypothetical protein